MQSPGAMQSHVTIIAEAGVNHNGCAARAAELVKVAASTGSDVVKFQSFKAASLVTSSAKKAAYQQAATGGGQTQYEMLRELELSADVQRDLARACENAGIEFMSTPFDVESLETLTRGIGVRTLKLGSGDMTNGPLLLSAARTGLPIIVSTGMSTLAEVEMALGVIAHGYLRPGDTPNGSVDFLAMLRSAEAWDCLHTRVILLHCTTEYPAPSESVNLRAMATLRSAFGIPVGFSDHTVGTHMAVAAVAMGARVVEKHFTLDRNLPGPDHKASLEPVEFARMVSEIREVEAALGHGRKAPAAAEAGNLTVARRSLVACRPIRKGEKFTAENLAAKRPGTGIAPFYLWDHIGRLATRDYAADEGIEP